ncbi:phosphoenolpyruvate synthase [Patescibacteria group bacterium]|nr:phosphoenolpyruvate synthase [Patescibacteria group bacterium]
MKYIVWFSQIDKEDVDIVGGKGANLGEIRRIGSPVPDGFVVTSKAYFEFLEKNKLGVRVEEILGKLDYNNQELVDEISEHIKDVIKSSPLPEEIISEVRNEYKKLSNSKGYVAVRSSATVEDLSVKSFAGQLDTFLNLNNLDNILSSIKKCWASLYNPRALLYLKESGLGKSKIGVAVIIQEMVQSEVSGVMLTVDPMTNNKDRLVIESVWGLGNLIVEGVVTPDHYEVAKSSFTIINKKISTQTTQLILAKEQNKEIPVSAAYQNIQKVSDEKIIELAKIGRKIENTYLFPQDIEWAIENNKLYILQSRPVTSAESEPDEKFEKTEINLPVLVKGTPTSPGIAQGVAKIIKSSKQVARVKRGDILVLPVNNHNFIAALKKAAAVITDKGGETSHAAIIAREMGLPCVVGTSIATNMIKPDTVVTVNGSTGIVYKGGLPYKRISRLVASFEDKSASNKKEPADKKTATKIFVNLVDSTLAYEISQKNVDGVGLLRAEFLISEIGIHPKKLIEKNKKDLYIKKIIEGLKISCASFDPRPVVYRVSDYTSNEYKNFKNGSQYEIEEENPLLGFRGAIRYISEPEIFSLELEAIKYVRNKLNLKNLWLLIPYVRTLEEMANIKRMVAASGLHRSSTFKLILSVEVPSTVFLIDKFLDIGIDGISIDLADLTSLLLGADRGNEKIFKYFSDLDKSVLWALERVIKEARRKRVYSTLVGQNTVLSPQLVDKVIEWGIDSISVTPDMIESTRNTVYEAEKRVVVSRKK